MRDSQYNNNTSYQAAQAFDKIKQHCILDHWIIEIINRIERGEDVDDIPQPEISDIVQVPSETHEKSPEIDSEYEVPRGIVIINGEEELPEPAKGVVHGTVIQMMYDKRPKDLYSRL